MDKNIFFELATKVLSNEASDDERQTFDRSLQHQEYKKLFEWLKTEWNKELKYPPGEFDYAKGLERLKSKIAKSARQDQVKKQRTHLLKRTIQIAASILIFMGIGMEGYKLLNSENTEKQVNYITYTTNRGEREMIELPDGSKVHLNAETTMRYPEKFSKKERNIEMTGEAFFEVKKNRNRPFIVHSGELYVKVVGTSFNIHAFEKDQKIQVSVASGKVIVGKSDDYSTPDQNNQTLLPGQQLTYEKGKQQFLVADKIDIAGLIAWKDGILVFNETSFNEVVPILEKWYGIKIHLHQKISENHRITAEFDNLSLIQVLDLLGKSSSFSYQIDGNDIHIYGKNTID